MKFGITLLCLAIFLVNIDAQTTTPEPGSEITTAAPSGPTTTVSPAITTVRPTCLGSVAQPACSGRRDPGNTRGTDCASRANRSMWHFNERTRLCRSMPYRGCGGNNNRFCSRAECEQRCRPPA